MSAMLQSTADSLVVEAMASDKPPEPAPAARHLGGAVALAMRTPVHEHLLSADAKAAAIVTLLGIMCTVLARGAESLHWLMLVSLAARVSCLVLLVGFTLTSLSAMIQAFRTISPRFPKAKPSLAFFGLIASMSCEKYIAEVMALSPDEALDQMLLYNHTASQIGMEKYRQLRRGLRMFELAFLCWLPLVVLLAVGGLLR